MARKEPPHTKKRVLRTARFRVLPLTLAMLTLLFLVKLNDLYLNSRQLSELLDTHNANAADAPDAGKQQAAPAGDNKDAAAPADAKPADALGDSAAKPADAAASGDKPADTAKADDKSGSGAKKPDEPKTQGVGHLTLQQVEEIKAREDKQAYTQTELDLLQNLAKRRDELDQREKDLEVKSAVLDATEKRIDDKISDMKTLQAQLSKVVADYQQQQGTEIRSLVKIYENMKPTDAAAIFNEMDMPILLEVIDKMNERKVAPVLAGMDPKKARDVTQELAEMRRSQQKLSSAAQAAAPAGK